MYNLCLHCLVYPSQYTTICPSFLVIKIRPSYIPYEFIFYSEERSRTFLLKSQNTPTRRHIPEHNPQHPLLHLYKFIQYPTYCYFPFYFWRSSPPGGQALFIHEICYITHNDAPNSVRLLWTCDKPDAETST